MRMSDCLQPLRRAFNIAILIVVLTFSLLFSLPLLGHSLVIRSCRLRSSTLSLFALKYTHKPSKSLNAPDRLSISSPRLRVSLHRPTFSNPTILVLNLYDYDYIDEEHRVSISRVNIIISLFPVLTRVTAGPFITVTLDDFRIRVFSSENTPEWMQRLRGNLVYTVLNGDTFRLDDLATNVILCTIGERPTTAHDAGKLPNMDDNSTPFKNGLDETKYTHYGAAKGGPCEEDDKPVEEPGEEAIVSMNSSQWHIQNFRFRHYVFGSLAAQLRRSWDGEWGSFVLIAKDSKWVQAVRPYEIPSSGNKRPAWGNVLWHVLSIPLTLPLFLIRTIRDPGSSINLYVPRADITFDRFRLQDAELVRQGWGWIRREYVEISGGDVVKDAIWEAILAFLD